MKNRGVLLIVVPVIIGAVVSVGFKSDDRNFQISRSLETFHAVFRELDMFYVDTIDARKVINKGIDDMLSSIDPYTVFYPEDNQKDLKMLTTGKYAGIGAIIRKYDEKDYVVIQEIYENMPADKWGVKAGDMLIEIDGENLKNLPVSNVSDRLRGEPDSKFVLTVKRPGVEDTLRINITRSGITLPSVPYYGLLNDIGYILIESFTEGCSRDVRKAVIELKSAGATSIIVDLSNNGGGLLGEAVEVVTLFVPKGTLVVTTRGKTRQSSAVYYTKREPLDTKIPLAIIVNEASASASEIVAGALQDMDRAVIVGSRTFGKGLVQTTRQLPYNGTLKVTTSKYYIPSGRCIQAIDYSNRNPDGTADKVQDSLTNLFYTVSGREVRDGGGVRPDIISVYDTIPEIIYTLSVDQLMFDFVNNYCLKHPSIPTIDMFQVSDSLYRSFKEYVINSGFSFKSQSGKTLDALRVLASIEGLYDKASEEFTALEKKLEYDLNKDIDLFSDHIKTMLGVEIVNRYYYQKGRVRQAIKNDKIVETAATVLTDKQRYASILNIKVSD